LPLREYPIYESDIAPKRVGLFSRLLKLIMRLTLLVVVLFFATLLVFRWAPIPTSAFIHQQNSLATKQPKIYEPASYTWVDWEDISPNLAIAVIAAEDQRFSKHWGVDMVEIQNALLESGGKNPRGASTITQQVAKNLFLWNGRSYSRKLLELGLSFAIELVWSKQRILEVYLNIAQFGDAIYGAQEASLQLFDKKPSALTMEEAALLASVLPKPAISDVNDPHPHLLKKKQWVLKQMKQLGGKNYLRKL